MKASLHRTFLRLKQHHQTRRLFNGRCLPKASPSDLPRTVFLFWDKGFDAAPEICQTCLESWQHLNPDWDLVVLDRTSANRIMPWDSLPSTISLNHYANMLRSRLLFEQGGVWADATLLCLKPLDAWLPHLFGQTDFFVFARPGPDRVLSNWFLAAAPGAPLMRAWLEASERLWRVAPHSSKPYFWHHYTFEYVLRGSSTLRKAWSAVPQISADPLHRLQRCLVNGKFTDADWATIDASPLQKLSHKKPEVTRGLPDALISLEVWRMDRRTGKYG